MDAKIFVTPKGICISNKNGIDKMPEELSKLSFSKIELREVVYIDKDNRARTKLTEVFLEE